MPARSRRIRSMAEEKLTSGAEALWTPNSVPLRESKAARAARIIPLDGTQPTLKQSPPRRLRSTKAPFAPTPAAPAALTNPAVPAPTTTKLYLPEGVGLTHFGG